MGEVLNAVGVDEALRAVGRRGRREIWAPIEKPLNISQGFENPNQERPDGDNGRE